MATTHTPDLAHSEEDSYSVIERLADAIRIEDDVRITAEDRKRLVQDLYEGPRKCQCCINWVDEIPPDVDLEAISKEEDPHPLIIRRRVMPGEGKTQVSLHSIEVRNLEVRKVLVQVFSGLDGIVPDVKYLVLLAPFCQFFWRWDRFEAAIEEQQNEIVKAILIQLRSIVRAELAEAFAVSKELTSAGAITYKYLWTIFPPGELIHSCRDGPDRFYTLQSSRMMSSRNPHYLLSCKYVDWDGDGYGYAHERFLIWEFKGTKKIAELKAHPAKYLDNYDGLRDKCIERGRRLQDLAGLHYKSYHGKTSHRTRRSDDDTDPTATKSQLDRRIILDGRGHPDRQQSGVLEFLCDPDKMYLSTGLISQAPIDTTPPGGHRPLPPAPAPGMMPGMPPPPGWPGAQPRIPNTYNDDPDIIDVQPRRRGNAMPRGGPPPPPGVRRPRRSRSADSLSSLSSAASDSSVGSDKEDEPALSDLQSQLCNNRMRGFSLKEKAWRTFDVNKIHDIEWNTAPFDSLVLPDGYKDLILSFVESQLKDGEAFDDVINGKGGGLVILLSGDPGVGKTLTAESVAERIHAPLYKMELGQLGQEEEYENGKRDEDEINKAFELAAKWRAVLLIDECDMYLEKRSDESPRRNRIVSRFLQELEYYPSLLFLTTNREKDLDPAIYSRIHLTINYPALDAPSRRTIWRTFLDREDASAVSDAELDILAGLEVNGRRIRNITKTARIMAKREGRGILFEDIRHVMRITEGLAI